MAQRSKAESASRTAERRRRRQQEALVWREIRRLGHTHPTLRDSRDIDVPCTEDADAPGTEAVTIENEANGPAPRRAVRPGSGETQLARRTREMRVRNLVAVEVAAALGFILGLLEALQRLPYGPTLRTAEVGLAIAVVVGLLATFRSREPTRERVVVSLLRAGLSGGVFAFVFEGMRLLLTIGEVGLALASWIWAGILALLLARLAPAGQPPSRTAERRAHETQASGQSGRRRPGRATVPGPAPTEPRAGPSVHSSGGTVSSANEGLGMTANEAPPIDSPHHAAILDAEARRVARVLARYGVLTRRQLAELSGARLWQRGRFPHALDVGIERGMIRDLGFDFYAPTQGFLPRPRPRH